MSDFILNGDWYGWVLIPALIFASRIVDVSLGTMRVISVSRGAALLGMVFGFFEILVWLLAMRAIFQRLDNPWYMLAYCGGFSAGNYVGVWLEGKLAIGKVVVQTVTAQDPTALVARLREQGFGVTTVAGQGAQGPVHVIYTVIGRGRLESVLAQIRAFSPKVFYTIEDIRVSRDGVHPLAAWNFPRPALIGIPKGARRGKGACR